MKNCCKCGKSLEDNMKFCFICGAEQTDKAEEQTGLIKKDTPKLDVSGKFGYLWSKVKKFFKGIIRKIKNVNPVLAAGILGGAVLVIVALVLFFRVFVGSGAMSPKSAVRKYLKAIDKESEKALVSATMSNRMYKVTSSSRSDLIETLDEEVFNLNHEDVDYKDIKIKSIRNYNAGKVKDYNEEYSDEYDKNPRFSKMVEIEGTYRVRTQGEPWDKEVFQFIAYKQAGNWYVLDKSVMKFAYGEALKIKKDKDALYELKEVVDELLMKDEFKGTTFDSTEIYENGCISLEKVGNNEAFVDAVRDAFDNNKVIDLKSKLGVKKSKTSIKISVKNGACVIRVKSELDDNDYCFTIDKVKQSE